MDAPVPTTTAARRAPTATAPHGYLLLAASAVLMLTMGVRQTTGLFVEPIHRDTGLGIAAISFALAVG
ncbi:MFS transporter, partial [Paraburkholderia sp. SIMBA_054]